MWHVIGLPLKQLQPKQSVVQWSWRWRYLTQRFHTLRESSAAFPIHLIQIQMPHHLTGWSFWCFICQQDSAVFISEVSFYLSLTSNLYRAFLTPPRPISFPPSSLLTRTQGCRFRLWQCNSLRFPWCSWWGQNLQSWLFFRSPPAHSGQPGPGGCNFEIPDIPFPKIITTAGSSSRRFKRSMCFWLMIPCPSQRCTVYLTFS